MRRQLLALVFAVLGASVLAASSSFPASPAREPVPGQMLLPPLVVLRMETVGGFAPLQALLTRVPTFTLYADGTAIYRRPAEPDAEEAGAAPLAATVLSSEQMVELLDFALTRGGLSEAREAYRVGGIADATTTVFTVRFADAHKTVSVYALGLGVEGPDRRAYRRFHRLADVLADFDARLPSDAVVTTFEPATYRAVFVEDDPEQPGLLAWPWTDLGPADLVAVPDAPAILQADLTPEQAALVTAVPSGGTAGIGVLAPDGTAAWRLSVRPLLPDEPMAFMPEPAPPDSQPTEPAPTDGQAYELSE